MQAFSIGSSAGDLLATQYDPEGPARHTLILAHGAGAGQAHPWMRARAADLAARGVRVVTFDFPYVTARRKVPDRAPVLIAAWRAVVDDVARRWPDVPLAIGGKSMGGRMATMLVAEPDAPAAVRGCVALGYPLHPPGKPEQLRVAHLGAIRVALLVVQGGRDPFGGPDDIRREFAAAGAHPTVVDMPFGGHGFEVRARDARQADEYARVADAVSQWLDTLQPAAIG
ncbi:alpha/beta hydrolase [Luteitalea sp. TBR-22]|uniref:alpha/beta hydrolase family protein n=1 Tax=Luteitalea sp. TBR-22 TaxID=2802971 RepID=UPI001AF7ADF1|nr:alpha/beta fold hydrolase [Luteitalea sp. TBR-22]BCS35753.1 alpha/beta hydrolase [Luteitalea sp. TBR-22]